MENINPKIRLATIEDYNKVRSFDPHSKYINPEKICTKLKSNEIILAIENSKIIGLIKFSYFWATRPFIDLIYVKEDFRKFGIGKKMLGYLENYLCSQNNAYLFSSTEDKDDKARIWHEKNGFKRCGKVKCLNLPHDKTSEIFFYKRISKKLMSEDTLPIYQ